VFALPSSHRVVALLLAIGALTACSRHARPDGGEGLLPVGSTAPDFAATGADGAAVRLSSVKGPRVVYFYPKDETPGCTKEACAFRDAFQKYEERGITIFGVSRDTEESHAKFRGNHQLPFPLAADPKGDIQHAYGVPDRLPGIASRVTFVVGVDGKVSKVFEKVDPGVHSDEVLAAIP
jgi:peroxiredoxin Q/BCP